MEQPYQDWLQGRQDALGITVSTLAPLVEDVCGDVRGLQDASRIVSGHSSVVFDIPTAEGHVIVRAKVAEDPAYEAEEWARLRCRAVGVPAPRIIGVRRALREDGSWLSVCVEERCSGRPLAEVFSESGPESERSLHLAGQVGAFLSRMHGVQPDGFGELSGSGAGRHPTYAAHLVHVTDAAVARLAAAPVQGIDLGVVRSAGDYLQTRAGLLEPPRASLLHKDAGPDHWFVEGDRIVGLIDLEAVEGGDPAADLAGWDYWRSWPLPYAPTEAVVSGYGDTALLRPGTLAERLRLARLVDALTTLDFWVASGRDDATRRSNELLREEVGRLAAGSPSGDPRAPHSGGSALPGPPREGPFGHPGPR